MARARSSATAPRRPPCRAFPVALLLALIRRAIRQAELKGYRLDGIETDRTRSDLESAFLAFADDHQRDLELRRQGYAVHRFTDEQLEAEPDRVAADIREALS